MTFACAGARRREFAEKAHFRIHRIPLRGDSYVLPDASVANKKMFYWQPLNGLSDNREGDPTAPVSDAVGNSGEHPRGTHVGSASNPSRKRSCRDEKDAVRAAEAWVPGTLPVWWGGVRYEGTDIGLVFAGGF